MSRDVLLIVKKSTKTKIHIYIMYLNTHQVIITSTFISDRLTTLSTHHQRADSDNSQSVTSTDHQHGNITVAAGMYTLSNGERFVS